MRRTLLRLPSRVGRAWHGAPLSAVPCHRVSPPLLPPTLQDRAVCVPKVFGDENAMFFGVFDGTVGDYAAEFVHLHAAQNICGGKVRREQG